MNSVNLRVKLGELYKMLHKCDGLWLFEKSEFLRGLGGSVCLGVQVAGPVGGL